MNSAPSDAKPAGTPNESWYLKVPEGQVYGPVGKAELEQWVRDGRINDKCEIRPHESDIWQTADSVYPVLKPPPEILTPSGIPGASTSVKLGVGKIVQPNRGLVIFTLGILGLIVWCPVFSIVAWILGTKELHEVHEGKRDRGGESFARVGRMLGIVMTMLWIALSIAAVFGAMMGAFAGWW